MPWKSVADNSGVYVLPYEAKGFGQTNCTAIKVEEGIVIMSPASDLSPIDLRWILDRAPVIALIAPHAGHTLGIKEWKAKLPKVPVYAAPRSMKRIKRVCKVDVKDIRELKTKSSDVEFIVAPGTREMNILIAVHRGEREIVYADEELIDLEHKPRSLLSRVLFRLNKVGVGFQVNWNYLFFFVKDKKALSESLLNLIRNNPIVIFAHGPIRTSTEDLAKTRTLLESVLT